MAKHKTAQQPLPPDRLRRGYACALRQPKLWFLEWVLPEPAAGEAERWAQIFNRI